MIFFKKKKQLIKLTKDYDDLWSDQKDLLEINNDLKNDIIILQHQLKKANDSKN